MIGLKAKASESSSTSKALKATEISEESDTSDESSEDEENSIDDEISLISRNLKKLWRRRGRGDRTYKYNSKSFTKDKKGKNEIVCFECKKPGHMRSECPYHKRDKKKFQKRSKRKGLLSTWDDSEGSSSEEEEAGEVAHIALMANTDSDSEDESEVMKELSDLKEAFENLLTDSNVLITHYSEQKKKNEELTLQISEKNKIIQELSDRNLDLSEKNKLLSFQKDSNETDSSSSSKEVEILQQKVEELTLDLSKFVNGTKNLKRLLETSRHPSDKSGPGYQKDERNIT